LTALRQVRACAPAGDRLSSPESSTTVSARQTSIVSREFLAHARPAAQTAARRAQRSRARSRDARRYDQSCERRGIRPQSAPHDSPPCPHAAEPFHIDVVLKLWKIALSLRSQSLAAKTPPGFAHSGSRD
jgi:hypothetical protein